MSITAETAKEHAHDPAVLCCRAEAGITIEPANLEDPAIFDDLVDSGLLSLDGCLTIEEVLGATLTKTCDSLCPLTPDVLDGVKAPSAPAAEEAEEEAPAAEAAAPVAAAPVAAGGTLKMTIRNWLKISTWRSSLLTNITPILRPSWTFSRSLQKKATLTLVQV